MEVGSSEANNFFNFMDYYYDSSMNPFAVMLQKREQKEEKKKRIKEGVWFWGGLNIEATIRLIC